MKIAFEDIISAANTRKDNLLRLQDILNVSDVDEMYQKLTEVYAWASELKEAYDALDMEGRNMVPAQLRDQIYCTNLVRLYDCIDNRGAGKTRYGFLHLCRAVHDCT